MMEEKKTFGTKLEDFFAGKGFYIVLLLCVAVIGVSAWSMLSGGGRTPEASADMAVAVAGIDENDAVAVGVTVPVLVTEPPATRIDVPETPAEEPADVVETEAPAAVTVPEDPVPVVGMAADYYIWPVSGTVENGYSIDMPVFNRTMRDWRTHDGVDIAADMGEQVRAAANGTVASVHYDERLGTTVVLSHGGGLESVYANLAGTPAVSEGEQVGVGQVIGAVGDTALYEIGEVSHLHFAMTLNGESVDPGEYLP